MLLSTGMARLSEGAILMEFLRAIRRFFTSLLGISNPDDLKKPPPR
jgi:hypothetical protein